MARVHYIIIPKYNSVRKSEELYFACVLGSSDLKSANVARSFATMLGCRNRLPGLLRVTVNSVFGDRPLSNPTTVAFQWP